MQRLFLLSLAIHRDGERHEWSTCPTTHTWYLPRSPAPIDQNSKMCKPSTWRPAPRQARAFCDDTLYLSGKSGSWEMPLGGGGGARGGRAAVNPSAGTGLASAAGGGAGGRGG